MVKFQPSKLATWVRFPSPAPTFPFRFHFSETLAPECSLNASGIYPIGVNAPVPYKVRPMGTRILMRILLQDTKTGLYLQNETVWTHSIDEAFDFGHSQRALEYAGNRQLSETRVVAAFLDGGYLNSIPLNTVRQSRRGSAARGASAAIP
jgi:hypothetical protein